MNRIDQLFSEQSREVLSVYITAGYPALNDTSALLRALQDQGVDMVEIGIPFSDPLADGPVIQHSSQVALRNGMNLKLLFSQLAGIRASVRIPMVLMGYLNPVLQMGMETFLGHCRDVGIDGVIIPDLPPEEYEASYLELFREYGIHHILLITPQTGVQRIRKISRLSSGFLYMVAAASTTGAKSAINQHQLSYFQRIREMDLPLPALIGFGISNHETFTTACRHARGAIIGSAFIKALEGPGSIEQKVEAFVGKIRKG